MPCCSSPRLYPHPPGPQHECSSSCRRAPPPPPRVGVAHRPKMHLRCTYDVPKMHLSRRSVVVLVAPRLYPHPYPHRCLNPPALSTSARRRAVVSTPLLYPHPSPLSSPAALRARVLVVVLSSSPRLLHPPASIRTRAARSTSARRRAVVFSTPASILTPHRCPHPRPSEHECSSSCRRLLHPPPLSSPAPLGARVLVVPSSSPPSEQECSSSCRRLHGGSGVTFGVTFGVTVGVTRLG